MSNDVDMTAEIVDGGRFDTIRYPDDEIMLRVTSGGNFQVKRLVHHTMVSPASCLRCTRRVRPICKASKQSPTGMGCTSKPTFQRFRQRT